MSVLTVCCWRLCVESVLVCGCTPGRCVARARAHTHTHTHTSRAAIEKFTSKMVTVVHVRYVKVWCGLRCCLRLTTHYYTRPVFHLNHTHKHEHKRTHAHTHTHTGEVGVWSLDTHTHRWGGCMIRSDNDHAPTLQNKVALRFFFGFCLSDKQNPRFLDFVYPIQMNPV